jgi:hypothetical protein
MKDAVKITVIATGFKDSDRPHRHDRFSISSMRDSRVYHAADAEPDPEPVMVEPPRTAVACETVPVESVQTAAPPAFDKNDLDVPAFLRKRGDAIQ